MGGRKKKGTEGISYVDKMDYSIKYMIEKDKRMNIISIIYLIGD